MLVQQAQREHRGVGVRAGHVDRRHARNANGENVRSRTRPTGESNK